MTDELSLGEIRRTLDGARRRRVNAMIEQESALIRLGAVSEPAYWSMVVEEATRRGEVMGSPTAGIESVYQDIVSARWVPRAEWGP